MLFDIVLCFMPPFFSMLSSLLDFLILDFFYFAFYRIFLSFFLLSYFALTTRVWCFFLFGCCAHIGFSRDSTSTENHLSYSINEHYMDTDKRHDDDILTYTYIHIKWDIEFDCFKKYLLKPLSSQVVKNSTMYDDMHCTVCDAFGCWVE